MTEARPSSNSAWRIRETMAASLPRRRSMVRRDPRLGPPDADVHGWSPQWRTRT